MNLLLLASLFTFFSKFLYKAGPFFLFVALLLGIVGLPIPDEILLITSGYLIAHQKLNLYTTLICAFLGSMCGITISYFIGRLIGMWVVKKYGENLNITPERVKITQSWFSRVGKWILIIGYFVPLFRHIVGFVAGAAKMNFKSFALYAYSGAIIWCLTFLGIGYYFHDWVISVFGKYMNL